MGRIRQGVLIKKATNKNSKATAKKHSYIKKVYKDGKYRYYYA